MLPCSQPEIVVLSALRSVLARGGLIDQAKDGRDRIGLLEKVEAGSFNAGQIEALGDLLHVIAGRYDEMGRGVDLDEAAHEVNPIDARHHQIEDGDVRATLPAQLRE